MLKYIQLSTWLGGLTSQTLGQMGKGLNEEGSVCVLGAEDLWSQT